MAILNLTQHPAAAEQVAAGVVDLASVELVWLKQWLTFETLPSREDILNRARLIAGITAGHTHAMIGGAPFLMGPLEAALKERGITPLFAFSTREVEESVQPDGSVKKVAVFRHAGFVEAA